MRNSKRIAIAAFALAMTTAVPQANAVTMVNWSGASSFDTSTSLFSGFQADTLTDISGPGIYHTHGRTGRVFNLDLLLDNVWTNVWSASPSGPSVNFAIADISTPISFGLGSVSGIRLSVNPIVSYGFHNLNSDTKFSFDVTAVPIPAALPLLAGGLGLFGLLGWRRKRKARSV